MTQTEPATASQPAPFAHDTMLPEPSSAQTSNPQTSSDAAEDFTTTSYLLTDGDFRINLKLDTSFSDDVSDRIVTATKLLLQRAHTDFTEPFVTTANTVGLTWRRVCGQPLGTELPYMFPESPSTDTQRAEEEVDVIQAAIQFAFTRKPRTVLSVKKFAERGRNGSWTRGRGDQGNFATVGELRIALNELAFAAFPRDSDWMGVIAHEILHNLAWNHPNHYPGSAAMINYVACITADGSAVSDFIEPERAL